MKVLSANIPSRLSLNMLVLQIILLNKWNALQVRNFLRSTFIYIRWSHTSQCICSSSLAWWCGLAQNDRWLFWWPDSLCLCSIFHLIPSHFSGYDHICSDGKSQSKIYHCRTVYMNLFSLFTLLEPISQNGGMLKLHLVLIPFISDWLSRCSTK